MAGIENNTVFGEGFKLETSGARSISDMQRTSTDVSKINYVGDPEGNVSANPSSICHDPVSGYFYLKVSGTGNTLWERIISGSSVIVTRFTSDGTWTKNVNAKTVRILGWGGGAGGGSGARTASGTSCSGGSGGTGYGFIDWSGDAALFDASETVTIGTGGAGGVAQTSNSSNGNDGGPGTASSVGNISTTSYLNYGKAGVINTTITGGAIAMLTSQVSYGVTYTGNFGGGSENGGAGSPGEDYPVKSTAGTGGAGAGSMINGGGGGGGGISAAPGSFSGARGGNLLYYDSASIKLAGGSAGGGDGNEGGTAISTGGMIAGGTGGGGGASKTSSTASSGGAGGIPGGGGGGGGASLNGFNSGAGGAGARGEIWIYETL